MSSYGRSIQVVVTIQSTSLDPETVQRRAETLLETLLVQGDTVSSYYVDCECKHCATDRLEYLRGELRAERISYGELAELQSMADEGLIPSDDLELLEAAGVPEV
jgi:hypothetical protein